jgi:hypothetical protein
MKKIYFSLIIFLTTFTINSVEFPNIIVFDNEMGKVTFPHALHASLIELEPPYNCKFCHHMDESLDKITQCRMCHEQTGEDFLSFHDIVHFRGDDYNMRKCAICHSMWPMSKHAPQPKDCDACHKN